MISSLFNRTTTSRYASLKNCRGLSQSKNPLSTFKFKKFHDSIEDYKVKILPKIILNTNENLNYLNETLSRGSPIHAYQLDQLAAQLDKVPDNLFPMFKNLSKLFNHTAECLSVLNSTPPLIIYNLVKNSQFDLLYDLINDKPNHRMFPSDDLFIYILTNIIQLDQFKYSGLLSSEIMLQESLDKGLCDRIALISVLYSVPLVLDKYLDGEKPVEFDPLKDYKQDEDEIYNNEFDDENKTEIRYIRVKYMRPKFYDDHFLIDNQKILIAKTLQFFSNSLDLTTIEHNILMFISLCLSENYPELFDRLEKKMDENISYPFGLLRKSLEILKTFDEVPPDYAGQKLYSSKDKCNFLDRLNKISPLKENSAVDQQNNSNCIVNQVKEEVLAIARRLHALIDHRSLERVDSRLADLFHNGVDKHCAAIESKEEAEQIVLRKKSLLEKLEKIERIEMMRSYAKGDELMRVAFMRPTDPELLKHLTPSGESRRDVILRKLEAKYGKPVEPLQT
ncbi:MAG: Mitochondrial 28S ribosomal protein S27 [Marteilia pararefringens]